MLSEKIEPSGTKLLSSSIIRCDGPINIYDRYDFATSQNLQAYRDCHFRSQQFHFFDRDDDWAEADLILEDFGDDEFPARVYSRTSTDSSLDIFSHVSSSFSDANDCGSSQDSSFLTLPLVRAIHSGPDESLVSIEAQRHTPVDADTAGHTQSYTGIINEYHEIYTVGDLGEHVRHGSSSNIQEPPKKRPRRSGFRTWFLSVIAVVRGRRHPHM